MPCSEKDDLTGAWGIIDWMLVAGVLGVIVLVGTIAVWSF